MLRRLAWSLIGLLATGCTHTSVEHASLRDQREYGVIQMGPYIGYLVDPRTESCLLVYAQTAAAQVSCEKLAKNVPEARRYITWLQP